MFSSSTRGLARIGAVLALALPSLLSLMPGVAHAASFNSGVSVSLIAPGGTTTDGITSSGGPLDLQQLIPPIGQIMPGDGGDVGGFMLPTELIMLTETSILVRVAQGSSDGTTGYLGAGGEHARYVFSGLDVTGFQITGLSYSLADFYSPAPFVGASNAAALISGEVVKLASPHSVVLELDEIRFADRGMGESANFVDVRIDMQISAVPEPASVALALCGLAVLGVARARRRHL